MEKELFELKNENVQVEELFKIIENNMTVIDLNKIIYEVSNLYIKSNMLESYVGDIKLLSEYRKNRNVRGCREKNFENKSDIYIFSTPIEEECREFLEQINYFSEFEVFILRIMLYFKTTMHELTHIKQDKIYDSNDSIEKDLLKLGNYRNENKDSLPFYVDFYDNCPSEIMAEVEAFKITLKVLEKYGEACKNLYLFMKKKYLVYVINKYYQYGSNGPIMPYLKLVCRCSKEECDIFLNKVRSSDLRVGDRVMYGLGISEDEYTDIVNIYADVYNKIENLSGRKK